MNQSDFARLHNVSRKTVTLWKARGWLVLADEDIDVEASNACIKRYRKSVTSPARKRQGNKTGNNQGNNQGNKKKKDNTSAETPTKVIERLIAENGVTMTRDEALTMKENYLALLTRLEYDIKAGEVLPYKDMVEAVEKEYSRLRTRLIAIAPEHGPRLRVLASATNDAEFVRALQEVVYEALEELSLDADACREENGSDCLA